MSSADTNNIGIRLQAAGENLNTWGDPYLNQALIVLSNLASKWLPLVINGDTTIVETLYSTTNTTEVACIDLVAGTVAAAFNLVFPSRPKRLILRNSTGFTGTPKLAATTGFSLPTGRTVWAATDGVTDMVNVSPNYGGTPTPRSGSLDIGAWSAVEAALAAAALPGAPGTVRISALDTGPDFVNNKVSVAGSGLISFTKSTTNPGANEVLAETVGTVGYTATGTDTYAITPAPAISAYSAGQVFLVTFTNANTTAPTIAVSGLAAKSITKNGATALDRGDIAAGAQRLLTYDGTQFQISGVSAPPPGASEGLFMSPLFGQWGT